MDLRHKFRAELKRIKKRKYVETILEYLPKDEQIAKVRAKVLGYIEKTDWKKRREGNYARSDIADENRGTVNRCGARCGTFMTWAISF